MVRSVVRVIVHKAEKSVDTIDEITALFEQYTIKRARCAMCRRCDVKASLVDSV